MYKLKIEGIEEYLPKDKKTEESKLRQLYEAYKSKNIQDGVVVRLDEEELAYIEDMREIFARKHSINVDFINYNHYYYRKFYTEYLPQKLKYILINSSWMSYDVKRTDKDCEEFLKNLEEKSGENWRKQLMDIVEYHMYEQIKLGKLKEINRRIRKTAFGTKKIKKKELKEFSDLETSLVKNHHCEFFARNDFEEADIYFKLQYEKEKGKVDKKRNKKVKIEFV